MLFSVIYQGLAGAVPEAFTYFLLGDRRNFIGEFFANFRADYESHAVTFCQLFVYTTQYGIAQAGGLETPSDVVQTVQSGGIDPTLKEMDFGNALPVCVSAPMKHNSSYTALDFWSDNLASRGDHRDDDHDDGGLNVAWSIPELMIRSCSHQHHNRDSNRYSCMRLDCPHKWERGVPQELMDAHR